MPALLELARDRNVPVSGKDFYEDAGGAGPEVETAGCERMVLDKHFGQPRRRSAGRPRLLPVKEVTKSSALEHILQEQLYPDLYKDVYHKVRIEYYPPRGDAKEGWDNIDIFGWLGYPMQIKINFLCRDSILAAPLVLDLVLFMDLAQRAGAIWTLFGRVNCFLLVTPAP